MTSIDRAEGTRRPRRLWLFARDYVDGLSQAWELARYRDCERVGHRWGPLCQDDLMGGLARVCDRCKVSQLVEYVPATEGRERTPPSTPAPGYESLPPGWRPDRSRS